MINIRRKISRYRSMGWRERLGRFRWYGSYPLLFAARLVLVGIYILPAVVLLMFGVRFLVSRVRHPNFGHLALEPQLYLKGARIGAHGKYRAVMLFPHRWAANRALLNYWENSLRIVSHPVLVAALWPFTWFKWLTHDIFATEATYSTPDGRNLSGAAAYDEIIFDYFQSYPGDALLRITDEHRNAGEEVIRKWGIPDDAWWVCLHVRESDYHARSAEFNAYRDADPTGHIPAVEAIVQRGGWVVRIGDRSMSRLPAMDHFVDYIHTDDHADWMDLFLMARTRFFLGADSGPPALALAFDRPAIQVNCVPMGHGSFRPGDLFLPKLYWSQRESRLLTFSEVLLGDGRYWTNSDEFELHDINLVDNTAEEIRSVTIEMLDRLDRKALYSSEDEVRQTAYMRLLAAGGSDNTFGLHSRIGRDFLSAHSDLLERGASVTPARSPSMKDSSYIN
jgi:putative glycosyltransferase (TIGR04372 family)